MDYFTDLREMISQIPVVDAHEHLIGYSECGSLVNVIPFLFENYLWSMVKDLDLSG